MKIWARALLILMVYLLSIFLFFFLLWLIFSCIASANSWQNLQQGDQTASTFLNQLEQKKMQGGAHPFYQGLPPASNYSSTDLVVRSQAAAGNDPASQMIYQSSDARPQIKIDPVTDPLLTGSNRITENPLILIGGSGTQAIEVQQGGKTETLNCEESGEDSLENCTRELTVKVIKTKVEKKWNGIFQYSKCCDTDRNRSRHSPPCIALRNAVITAKKSLRAPRYRRNTPPQPAPVGNLDITEAYKACMTEMNGRRKRGCSCDARLPSLPFSKDQIKKVLLARHPQYPQTVHMAHKYFHQYNSGRIEYDYQYYFEILYEEDSYEVLPDEWSDNCARLEERVDQGLCGYYSRECTQPNQTRTI